MGGWLASWFGVGAAQSSASSAIRRFHTGDATLSRDSITVEGDGWLIEAREEQVVRLFEVAAPDAEKCLLIYRATMKSENLAGRAFLEMWCRLPGRGEFFSRGLNQPLKGTTDWASYEIPFRLKKGQRPDLIKLNVAVQGSGKVWIKDVELLKAPR
jgi:hypothetical protein